MLCHCPWGSVQHCWAVQQDLSQARLTWPRGYPLPLPLPQLPGCVTLSLPNSHPSPSDITRLHKRHPGPRTPGAAGWACQLPRSRSPSLVPPQGPVPGSRRLLSCRWRWWQRRGLAAIQWLLPRGWKLGSGWPSTGNPRMSLCAAVHTRMSVSAHSRVCFCRVCAGCVVSRDRSLHLPSLLAIVGPSSFHHLHLGTSEVWRHVQNRMSSPKGSGWGTAQVNHVEVTGAQLVPQLCSWTQGLECTLQKRAQCVSCSSSCYLPIFQGVHYGVIAKRVGSSWSQNDCRLLFSLRWETAPAPMG